MHPECLFHSQVSFSVSSDWSPLWHRFPHLENEGLGEFPLDRRWPGAEGTGRLGVVLRVELGLRAVGLTEFNTGACSDFGSFLTQRSGARVLPQPCC